MADGGKSGHLPRVLGLGFGLSMGVGAVIGAGILRTPGSVLASVPLAWLALALWAFAGVHALLTANIVAETMSALPRSGGLFNVAERAFGPFGAVLVGWTDWLFNVAASAALAIACGEFLAMIVPALAPHVAATGIGVAAFLFALNWIGVREGSAAQIVTSAGKLALLLGLVAAIFLLRPAGGAGGGTASAAAAPVGLLGIVVAYQLVVGTYAGWASPAYFAEEATDPARMPVRALFGSLAAVILVYLLMNAALLYALPVDRLAASALPVSEAIADIFGGTSVAIVAGVAIVCVLGTINAGIMLATRILHGLGRDGFVPAIASRVNRGGTPDVALGASAAATLALAATGEFEAVFLAVGALGIAILVVVDAAFFVLRRREPELARPFRARGHPWLPALALALDLAVLAAFLIADPRAALFMAAGIALCVPLTLIARRAQRAGSSGLS
jgi:APA family basic amino acid/polyamine antiporter